MSDTFVKGADIELNGDGEGGGGGGSARARIVARYCCCLRNPMFSGEPTTLVCDDVNVEDVPTVSLEKRVGGTTVCPLATDVAAVKTCDASRGINCDGPADTGIKGMECNGWETLGGG